MAVKMKGSRMQSKFFSLRFISCLLLVILLAGCATPAKHMTRISLGMSKEQVIQNLGNPTVARGAIRNKFDQTVEVWEYRLRIGDHFIGPGIKNYWLYFMEDKLVRWGEAGDWERESSQIYEFQFNPSPQL